MRNMTLGGLLMAAILPAGAQDLPPNGHLTDHLQGLCVPFVTGRRSAQDLLPALQAAGFTEQAPSLDDGTAEMYGESGAISLQMLGTTPHCLIAQPMSMDEAQAEFKAWVATAGPESGGPYTLKKGGTADAPTTYEGPHIDIYFESAGDQVTVDVSPR
jgi:hypothetical protein